MRASEFITESIYMPNIDDQYFKTHRFETTKYGGLKMVHGTGDDVFQIYVYSMRDQAMGAVMFRYDAEHDAYMADDLYVDERFRRQGIATTMYDFAKTKLDAPIKPSTTQTKKGAAFWQGKEIWESATPDDIFSMISDIHTGHHDIETDEEFQQWVGSFDKYELEDIPLSKLKVTQSNINADKAKSYIKQKNAPPIVVDGTNYWIIDGHHRVAAALARGDKTIKGYVGLNEVRENFHDGKKKGKSRPGRVKRAGASCKGSVTDLRAKAKKYSGERGKMYHWCANMKAGKKKKK
jgi:GNAT superfamily N-acetyltransferase